MAESKVVENTLYALVWKRADATVFSDGGQAPFCASEARHLFGVCDISDDSSMPKNPKRERAIKPARMTRESVFIVLILAYFRFLVF